VERLAVKRLSGRRDAGNVSEAADYDWLTPKPAQWKVKRALVPVAHLAEGAYSTAAVCVPWSAKRHPETIRVHVYPSRTEHAAFIRAAAAVLRGMPGAVEVEVIEHGRAGMRPQAIVWFKRCL
jgi:hypothetical protein